MSIPAALQFIAAIRKDPELARSIGNLGVDANLESLVPLGAGAGFAFTAEELRAAYKFDWSMRFARHISGRAPQE